MCQLPEAMLQVQNDKTVIFVCFFSILSVLSIKVKGAMRKKVGILNLLVLLTKTGKLE